MRAPYFSPMEEGKEQEWKSVPALKASTQNWHVKLPFTFMGQV